ncbi:hypothetical protein [Sphingobacterium prati]|uniref:hypothetical protein n=1 Tax=Sphingobacterium prati TaxID=2737006 RepID=UPI001553CEA8|nr:hypothetical protein [Sphingobacterium prati]NPE46323.1 hypothetical protein [Sphingobacterium prati]
MNKINHSSLRLTVLQSIGDLLTGEGFIVDERINLGVLEIINLLADYYEEGQHLFPEVLITNDINTFLETIPNKIFPIKETEIRSDEFKEVIKLCAPLALSGWVIFIQIIEGKMKYGLISAEMIETSPSMYNQTVGELKITGWYKGVSIVYLRNISPKVVEVSGLNNCLIVSQNLEQEKDFFENEIHQLALSISQDAEDEIKINLKAYIEKIIDQALKDGHGNLIGIISDTEEAIKNVRNNLAVKGGVFLEEPIDFSDLLKDVNTLEGEFSTNLRAYSSLLKSMLNHDGITIITSKGKVIGYHLLIDGYINAHDVISGGSRSKAFVAMKNCEHFIFCFYKSQDGTIKIWKK